MLTLNKELEIPILPQRIAVISSATAAGYGDFCHQLQHNSGGFFFYTELFPALMQGNQVEESVLAALDRINARINEFDVVVIIRGGGATSDLSGFDTYLLAAACAQFPLPIITGIGHERDDTVLDSVAHTRVKTPTAAAELLIHQWRKSRSIWKNYLCGFNRELICFLIWNDEGWKLSKPVFPICSSQTCGRPFFFAGSKERFVTGDESIGGPSISPVGTFATTNSGRFSG